jgi:hypothetical protein
MTKSKYPELDATIQALAFPLHARPYTYCLTQADPTVIKAVVACMTAFKVFYAFFRTTGQPLSSQYKY